MEKTFAILTLAAALVGLAYVLVSEWRSHVRIARAWQEGYASGRLLAGAPFIEDNDPAVRKAYNEGYRTGLSARRLQIAEPKRRTRTGGWTRASDYVR